MRPASDDPRLVAVADELARALTGRALDELPWDDLPLIWSGPLTVEGGDLAAANALVQQRWWHFTGRGALREVADDDAVVRQLAWLIGHDLAYEVELMPPAKAAELAETFVSLVPDHCRWFTNYDGMLGSDSVVGSTPLTDFTFDYGYVAVADRRAWVAWFVGED